MRIVLLDSETLGKDAPLDALFACGELTVYGTTAPTEVLSRIRDAEVIVTNKVKITRDLISEAKELKLICVTATGYDNIDVVAAREAGVGVCNVPGYSTDSVTLFTLATVLSLFTHLKVYNRFVSDGSYTASGVANRLTPVYHEMRGVTWGIIGYGNIGKSVARVAEALGANVIVYKRNKVSGVECVDIDELCRRSDIITIHCPLNADSLNLINSKKIAIMKKSVIIVNEARGAVVNEADIAAAIINGDIGGFGSDVYSVEPFPPSHPFASISSQDNVLLTPHAAWGSYEARERCVKIVASNINAFWDGKTQNRVDIT